MALRPRDNDPTIDLRAPASAPGCGGFAVMHPPGPLGCSVAYPGHMVPAMAKDHRPLQFAQLSGPLAVGVETKTPILGLHTLPKSAKEMQVFFQGRWKISPKEVKSWQDFANIIREGSPVDKLVVYSHGAPGQLRIGETEYGLEQENLRPLFLSRCSAKSEKGGSCTAQTAPGSAFCVLHRPRSIERWVGPRVRSMEFEG